MRIAVWFESSLGRNDGNPLYVVSFLKRVQHFCDVLEHKNLNDRLLNYFPDLKPIDPQAESFARWFTDTYHTRIDVEHLRPYGTDLHTFGKFDLHLWIDWGEDGLTGLLPYVPVIPEDAPLVYWASDTHLGYGYRLAFARRAQLTFCAQKRGVDEMAKDGVTTHWLPHAAEPLAYPAYSLASKKTDVCFVGHVNNVKRIDMLDRAFREFPNFYYGQARFENSARRYAESRVVLNCAMEDDLNMRVFEVLATGSLLVTDRIPTIETFFEDEKHLLLYDSLDEMVEKIRGALKDPARSAEISRAGKDLVLRNHTFANRIRHMLELAYPLTQKKEPAHV